MLIDNDAYNKNQSWLVSCIPDENAHTVGFPEHSGNLSSVSFLELPWQVTKNLVA